MPLGLFRVVFSCWKSYKKKWGGQRNILSYSLPTGTNTNHRIPLSIARIRHKIRTYRPPVMKHTGQPPHSLQVKRTEFTGSGLFMGYISVSEVMNWRLRSEVLTTRHFVARSPRPIHKTKYTHSSVTLSGTPTRPSVAKQILHTKILMYVPFILQNFTIFAQQMCICWANIVKSYTPQFPTTRLESTTEYGLLSYEHAEGMGRAGRTSLS